MKEYSVLVTENVPIAENIFRMRFSLPEKLTGKTCGKFVNISVGDGGHLLRRPIAICACDGDAVTICYQIKGEGTQLLSRRKEGDFLSALLPLGNGFSLAEKDKTVALVGGGVGIFPMVSVLRDYAGTGKKFYSYIGFRNRAAVCLEEEIRALSYQAKIVTDDGSYGEKANAVSALFEDTKLRPDVILACGPLPMLRALKNGLHERGSATPCYVSLEERMGCGIGACLVCACKKSGGNENVRVCKDGPVFHMDEVEF